MQGRGQHVELHLGILHLWPNCGPWKLKGILILWHCWRYKTNSSTLILLVTGNYHIIRWLQWQFFSVMAWYYDLKNVLSHMERWPLLYVHVGLLVQPTKASWWPLTFRPWKWCPESRVTWDTSVPILVFLSLSVLDLGLMYAIDRQTYVRQHQRSTLNTPSAGA